MRDNRAFQILWLLLILFVTPWLHAVDEAPSVTQTTAFYITADGYAVTHYTLVADAIKLEGQVGEATIPFTLWKFDRINDLAVLKPAKPLNVSAARLSMGEVQVGSPVTFVTHQGGNKGEVVAASIQGSILSTTGIGDDIRHLRIQIPDDMSPREGPVYSTEGHCLGFLSGRISNLYLLLQSEKEARNVFLASKVDLLFPLVKSLPGVSWVQGGSPDKPPEAAWTAEDSTATLLRLSVTHDPAHRAEDKDWETVREKIPQGVPFILVTISSGIDETGFARALLEYFETYRIGQTLSPGLKRDYYKAIVKRFGHSELAADELVKMAADLSNGYFVEASCSLAAGDVEDWVRIRIFYPKTTKLIADVKATEILTGPAEQSIRQLTEMAVKHLAREFRSKVPAA